MSNIKEFLDGLVELQRLVAEDKLSYLEMEQLNRAMEWTFPLQVQEDQ